jgi:hypothetical protein
MADSMYDCFINDTREKKGFICSFNSLLVLNADSSGVTRSDGVDAESGKRSAWRERWNASRDGKREAHPR